MKTLFTLTKRNIKLFFKDKGTFFSSLISPAILLVLYMVFLGNVYEGSFERNLPSFIKLSEEVVDGFVAGQLVSSLIAVTCVTVTFSTNFLMVQDKALRNIYDINVSPVKPHIVSLSYYLASITATLIVCSVTAGLGLIYLATAGWYMTAVDVLLLFVDVIILVLFGTALSSVIHFFLSPLGQIGVVGMVVGVCSGFLCGAYMPMSEFGEGLRNVLA
ncbi:MAG: ABC transporter permease, partial [Clostridia bacterium]|nr:ABC transporter permease [Clostridia bacterium]